MSGGLTMLRKLILAASTAALIATPAIAQDYSLEPNFGTFSLAAGFNPDPAELEIVAGGTVDASSVGCAGMISQAPDARLMWTGGQFSLGAVSDADTTIVVNTPDGSWVCADDTNGFNPEVTVSGSGQYDIWVGVFAGGTSAATLYATEF